MSFPAERSSTTPLHRATFAILGDPHFVVETPDIPNTLGSHLRLDPAGSLLGAAGTPNPWADLLKLVRVAGLQADAVLCAGDLCVAGDPTSLKAAWHHLNGLRAAIAAPDLFAATGNHDVRSRSNASKVAINPVRMLSANWGPFEKLKRLEPAYPVVRTNAGIDDSERRGYRTKYFGDGLVMVTSEHYRVLIINSCSEHTTDPFSNERGTYPESAEKALEIELAGCAEQRINVALLHHPPETHGRYNAGAHDFVERGEELVRQLSTHGHWLIIHGHKHDGRIRYASGSGRPPTIFAAASLGSHLETNRPGQRNQFYVVDVHSTVSGELRGAVKAWNWYAGAGWRPAESEDDGIFSGCGFGCRETPESMALKIAKSIGSLGLSLPCDWRSIVDSVEDLKYLPPESLAMIWQALRDGHRMSVEKDSDGRRFQLAQLA
jgi:hypothetical protein